MEDSTKRRSPRRVPQSLSVALLGVAVAGAGLLAFVTRGTNSIPLTKSAADASDGTAGEDGPLTPARRTPSKEGVESEPSGPFDFAPAAREEVGEIHVPSSDEALSLRRPKQEPRLDIVERGIVALVDPVRCEPPAELVEAGRSGDGVYGCVIPKSDGRAHVVGRAAHRKASGNLEVGDYEEGQRTGEWVQYYPTGVLAAEGSFLAGQRDGVWHEYDETGEHRLTRTYRAGTKHGVVIRYVGDTAEMDLYFEGGKYDPQTKEPVLRAEVAEAP